MIFSVALFAQQSDQHAAANILLLPLKDAGCCCRETAEAADRAVGEAAMVADAARADEIAAKRELQDLRQQLTEQLATSSKLVTTQDETIHKLYSQLEVSSRPPIGMFCWTSKLSCHRGNRMSAMMRLSVTRFVQFLYV